MLKKVLSISGKSGLFKLVSQGKNMYIAESLVDNKRIPIYPRDKVVSLGDIAIYTVSEEVPLSKVLTNISNHEGGKPIVIKSNVQPEELRSYFDSVLPDFDKERVYPSDIRKVMAWYNLLVNAGYSDFEAKEEEPEETLDEPVEAASEGDKKKKADSGEEKPAAKKTTKAKAAGTVKPPVTKANTKAVNTTKSTRAKKG